MKYSILLVAILGVTSLFSAENPQTTKSETWVQQSQENNIALQEARDEANEAKNAELQAREELAVAREEIAQAQKCIEESKKEQNLKKHETLTISVTGQGVAPMNTSSPAQAYALAKRAAIADAYRAIAEKVQGVRIDGQDLIKDMMVKRSVIRTSVKAMVRNANIVETTFKEGLCEVEMEIVISYSDFVQ
jgi:hypothetical protein